MTPIYGRIALGGVMTALITPFRDGRVDLDALADLVDWQIGQGALGLVACGTTGESPTLSHSEWKEAIRLCVDVAGGRVPVIAGSGVNDTRHTIVLTHEAARLGADAALVVTPYYNRPSQEGLFRHFDAVERSVDLPIVVYNVPARTGVDLGLDTLERLAERPGIIAIKDATGDLTRVGATADRFGNRFIQLSGHDRTMPGFVAAGGDGAIAVISNVAPMLSVAMVEAIRRGDLAEARRINSHLLPLQRALDLEVNPGPVKFALHCLRGYSPDLRLPLVEVASATAAAIQQTIVLAETLAVERSEIRRSPASRLSVIGTRPHSRAFMPAARH